MEGAYYIGRTRRHKKRLSRKHKFFLSLLLSLILLTVYFQSVLLPQVHVLCERAVTNRLEALASKKAYEILSAEEYRYDDFILLRCGDNGDVRSASVDTVKINLFKNRLALSVLEDLTAEDITVSVPAENMLGLLLLSGCEKELHVTARVASGMLARFHTSFETAGINQTRHAIGFSLDFTAAYLLPTGKKSLSFSVDIPLGETLIVGDVPDSLTQINRLTDDVSELEIDDAVDFGNVIS